MSAVLNTGDLDRTDPTAARAEIVLLLGPAQVRYRAAEIGFLVAAQVNTESNVHRNTLLLGRETAPGVLRYREHQHGVAPVGGEARWARLVSGPCPRQAALVPLFALAGSQSTGWRPFTQIAVSGDQVLFVALGAMVQGDPQDTATVLGWAAKLAERHRGHALQLNNHQRWFINARPGLEIEQKYTLSGRPDIWRLALAVRDIVSEGDLPGWMPEYRNDFEQWNFLTHLFEVGGEGERGDLAFIHAVDGSWIVRRKWYDQDAAVRREELTEGVVLPTSPDLEAVARDRFGVQAVAVGVYRRLRYNVMLESLNSGHVFSIMFDHCTAEDGRPDLFQVEVEYIRSRKVANPAEADDDLMAEFRSLSEWTRLFLDAQQVGYAEDHLSKRSWLKKPTRSRDKIP